MARSCLKRYSTVDEASQNWFSNRNRLIFSRRVYHGPDIVPEPKLHTHRIAPERLKEGVFNVRN